MIRHRPNGSGHPYLASDDQRVPERPLAGEPIEIRALASASVDDIVCQWAVDDNVQELTLRRVDQQDPDERGSAAATHLSTAATARRRGGIAWSATAPPLSWGQHGRYRLRARSSDGRSEHTRWFTLAAARWQPAGGTVSVTGRDRVVPGSTEWLVDDSGAWRVRFAVPLGPNEHVLGFGERFDRLDQRGHRLDAVVFEQYKGQAAAGRTYLPMPFAHVLGGSGWGFHVRTSRRTWYDVGACDRDALWIEAELGGRAELTIDFYDGSPQQVLSAFLDATGRPEPLPDWVHRLWGSGNEWNTQRSVETVVARHRDEDIPLGAIVIEAWSDESTFTAFRDAVYEPNLDGSPHRLADFTFPADGAWPDPKGLVDRLHEHDVRVLLWQIPLQKMRPHPSGQARADAETMLRRGFGVRQEDGRDYRNRGWWFPLALMPDLTNPEARQWWLAKRRYLVDELGIDGFKTDGGEHAWGADLRYADGRRGDEGNNVYPVHYAAAYGELLRAAGKAPVTFSRAGFTGSPAHGCFWAGDEDSTWDAYRASLTAGLTASACGIVYWGWDLAGFSGPLPSAELYLRSTATACFAPIMQYHSEFNHHRTPSRDRTPWNVAEQSGDPRALTIFRRFAHLRERLVPYLAQQTRAGIGIGLPLMRALPLSYPNDAHAWDHPYQYLLGDALLICPVTEPGIDSWSCYLPPGDWTDAWTGTRDSGGRVVSVDAPLDRIPVWCRTQHWPGLGPVFRDVPAPETAP